jgi:ATP-dependent Clp protease protease subunit
MTSTFTPPQTQRPVARGAAPTANPAGEATVNRLLASRIIVLGQGVDDDIANRLVGQMLLLNADDPEADIKLFINSPGGSVSAGMAIYDVMQFVPNDIVTVGMGLAASMGQFLLAAGAPGKRYVLPNARIMMHQPLGGIGGSAAEIQIQAEQMAFTKVRLAELIATHTGQTFEQITEDSNRDRWFSADDAVAYGLVDKVVRTITDL